MHVLRDVVQQHGQRALVRDATVMRLERRAASWPTSSSAARRPARHARRARSRPASLHALPRRLRARADDEQARRSAARVARCSMSERRSSSSRSAASPVDPHTTTPLSPAAAYALRFVAKASRSTALIPIAERRHHRCEYAAQIEHYRFFPRCSGGGSESASAVGTSPMIPPFVVDVVDVCRSTSPDRCSASSSASSKSAGRVDAAFAISKDTLSAFTKSTRCWSNVCI